MTEQTNHNTQSKNAGSTHFLNVKEVIAAILHYLVPGFEEMSIKDIVKECIDPVNSDESFVDTFISEGYIVDLLEFEDYLICIIKLPESLRKEGKPDRFLLHLQIQNQKPGYPLEQKMFATHEQLFIEQYRFLGIQSEEEFYRDAIPVLSIWFLFNQNVGETYTETFTETADNEKKSRFNNDYFHAKPIIVNIDKDIPSNEPIYGIIKNLIEGSEEEVKQTLDSLGAKIEID